MRTGPAFLVAPPPGPAADGAESGAARLGLSSHGFPHALRGCSASLSSALPAGQRGCSSYRSRVCQDHKPSPQTFNRLVGHRSEASAHAGRGLLCAETPSAPSRQAMARGIPQSPRCRHRGQTAPWGRGRPPVLLCTQHTTWCGPAAHNNQ